MEYKFQKSNASLNLEIISRALGKLQVSLAIIIVLKLFHMSALMYPVLMPLKSMIMGLNTMPISMKEKGNPNT